MTTQLYELRDQLMALTAWPQEPVVAKLPDGGLFHIDSVEQEDGVTMLVLGDWYDGGPEDDVEGSYGGDEEAPASRQDAHQATIADRAGLSDLHRPQTPQQPSEGGQGSRVGDTDYG